MSERVTGNVNEEYKQKIRIATIETWPYFRQQKDSDKPEYEGFIAELISRLANRIGFDYEFQLVKDGKYGTKNQDGTWSGLVGEVQRGEVDLAAAPLTVTAKRLEAVEFSYPFLKTGLVIVFKKPENDGQLPFHDIKTLLATDIPVGAILGGATASFLGNSDNGEFPSLWAAMLKHNVFPMTVQEGMDLVCEGNFAFIVEKDQAKLAERASPRITIATDTLITRDLAMALPTVSLLLGPLNKVLVKMQESGELMQLFEKYLVEF